MLQQATEYEPVEDERRNRLMGMPATKHSAAGGLAEPRWRVIAVAVAIVLAARGDGRAGLLDVFPQSGVSLGGDWSFSLSTAADYSGSTWSTGFGESTVYQAALKHVQRQSGSVVPRRSWELRLGKGGQIYSITSDFGEAVPPQYRPRGAEPAPWIDEVWQTVGVNRSLNDRTSDASRYYIHQAGTYLGDGLSAPFYSPLLAAGATADNGYSTVNWGQQAHIPSSHRSHLLYYQKTRDVGGGIVEVTNVTYNFGDHVIDWLNAPWGGSRFSTLGTHVIANPDDPRTYTDRSGATFASSVPEVLSATGGWVAFSQGTSPGHDALAIVTGHDTHLGEPFQWGASLWRHGAAGNTPGERDYLVGTLIRRVAVQPGETFFSRYYMVVGSLGNVVDLIDANDLVAKADYGPIRFTEAGSSRTGWTIHDTGGAISLRKAAAGEEDFFTYDQPVRGSKPLMLIEDAAGDEFITIDPYTLSGTPYDGATAYRSLLGYVLPGDKTNQDGGGISYTELASLFPADSAFFRDGASGMAVVSPVPEPSAAIVINVPTEQTQTQGQAGYPLLSGAIPLVKTGGGTLVLDAANSYSGVASVLAGTLAITNPAGLGKASLIDVSSSAAFDVQSIAGGFSVGGGQTLAGSGTVLGSVVFGAGSTLSPGLSSAASGVAILSSAGTGASPQAIVVPEPATLGLIGVGFGFLGLGAKLARAN